MPQQRNPNVYGYYGQLVLSQEDDPFPHLMLDGQVLYAGTPLVLFLQNHEIAGHIEMDQQGWYLDTNEVAIELHAGLWARLPR